MHPLVKGNQYRRLLRYRQALQVKPSGLVPNIAAGKIVVEEDPLLINIIRFKEMAVTGYVRDIFNQEIDISPIVVNALYVQQTQVEDNLAQTEKQTEDRQSKKFLDMCINDS